MKKTFPSFDDVKNGIDELLLIEKWDNYKILKNPNTFQKKVESLFLRKLRFFPTIFDKHNSNNFPFKFYRLRKKVSGFNPTLISEYSHPSATLMSFYQRANLPYHPVLYCSDSPTTAISEVVKFLTNVSSNDIYYLSQWDIVPNTSITLSPFLFGNLNENSFYKKWSDSNYERLEKTLKSEGISYDYNTLEKTLTFLSSLFVTENTYVVSSFIAHSHLYAPHNLRSDIFVFPSVQLDRMSVNYAIHPNFVIEKMRLNKVFELSFNPIQKELGVKYRLHNFGVNRDSIIFWNKNLNENIELIRETLPDFNF